MYKLRNSRSEKKKRLRIKRIKTAVTLLIVALIVWGTWTGVAWVLATQRPVPGAAEDCIATGKKTPGKSYSEVCPNKSRR